MTPFSVWAPTARRVELLIGDERLPMGDVGHGWWLVEASVSEPVDYRFSLDGGDPLPDPRSPRQPNGVHGPSRLVDHRSFEWRCDSWPGAELLGSVIYELHVGTFTRDGTFDAAVDHLDHLVSLGVDFVELLPVAAFPGSRGWGYDGVFPYAVQESYGGPDALKRFVDACHARGLQVILDVVYNHLGPDGNVLPRFGPYFTDKFATPWGQAVNFSDTGSDEVRRYFIDNALYWITEFHIDALRLDAVHAIFDFSARHILEEIGDAVHQQGRALGSEGHSIGCDESRHVAFAQRPYSGTHPARIAALSLPARQAEVRLEAQGAIDGFPGRCRIQNRHKAFAPHLLHAGLEDACAEPLPPARGGDPPVRYPSEASFRADSGSETAGCAFSGNLRGLMPVARA